ncbi:glycine/betaine ABC transporter ATPase [Alicyclobacillus cellulosilyticus]|uniref:Quaternary amine transport ATP-binding protein n=1 Tax=Alicyclobacillus cellulosilyticus TaxID=1003997 RepID=A0A917NK17_9BACL|nr:ABC transporter ATP-binding protein [Alicyclobacillus cellulosilyticus]GGJ03585.1 glycine/betaine ABC transporter ATPase [Alicyclobacillus cellulosilyticus]
MLEYEHVSKRYTDGTVAVEDFTLQITKGEFVVLIGPSGCGKSTTLRMTNRLIEPTSGTIYLEGHDYRTIHPVVLRRRLGYVIQQIGLMPHLTIADNITFVLKLMGASKAERWRRAEQLLALANMDTSYLNKYPRELSGGQQQRVGVLRALAHDPELILMDEPFGALDPITRQQLQDELKRLQRAMHKTILFVTHDMDEALRLADRIVMMRDGRIVQVDSPERLLRTPADEFVAHFIGPHRMLQHAGEIRVKEVMLASAVTIPADHGLAQALELMRHKKVNSLFVTDDDRRFVGIVLLPEVQAALRFREECRVGALAARSDAAVSIEVSVMNAIRQMLSYRLDAIPVVDSDGIVVGVVTRSTLAHVLDGIVMPCDGAVHMESPGSGCVTAQLSP